ncbi:ORF69 [Bovine gammaherpesvirus 6]|uniref:ORF69 n=1 Tax=Bovine gammaherpesvirus 6 TaxID=1504288 RepID=A0A060D3U0_9GAMA|nr:ORF69 [Bovine gammaherpesvirus 6]AIB03225.1 ORF69 [Bovine gammaherpesvirus 6]
MVKPSRDGDALSKRSYATKASLCSAKRKKSKSIKSAIIKKKKITLSNQDFFSGISLNHELGKDFLREMDTPICTSSTIFLPTDFSAVAPGRCLILSPYGHSSVLGFHCHECKPHCSSAFNQNNVKSNDNDEILSVSLCFLNHVEKVVQHKAFYLSLLGHSMNLVKQSLNQPSLLYCYIVLKKFCSKLFPIFTNHGGQITMFIIFNTSELHISETLLRILTDNVQGYSLSVDCFAGNYILAVKPRLAEEATVAVNVNKICDLVSELDFSDELKQDYVNGSSLISHFLT